MSPIPLSTPFSRNLNLLYQLVRRDFSARFAGSALGIGWAVLQPLTLVVLYWFVFTFMIPQGPGAKSSEYVFFLISGLVPWIGFNEGLMRSTTSIIDNSAVVRRLAFRSELIVIVPNASAIILELVGIVLFLLFLAATRGLSPMLAILPIAVLLQLMLQAGIGWILAALHVFFRDLAQLLGFVLSVVFYLSPILYPISHRYERLFSWNPLTPLLGLYRGALIGSPLPAGGSIVFLVVIAIAAVAGGLSFFRNAQATLTDLI